MGVAFFLRCCLWRDSSGISREHDGGVAARIATLAGYARRTGSAESGDQLALATAWLEGIHTPVKPLLRDEAHVPGLSMHILCSTCWTTPACDLCQTPTRSTGTPGRQGRIQNFLPPGIIAGAPLPDILERGPVCPHLFARKRCTGRQI